MHKRSPIFMGPLTVSVYPARVVEIQLSCSGCGDDPDNDTTTTATEYFHCGYVGAAMDCAGDLDFYVFQAAEAGSYSWTLDSNGQGGLQLIADDGQTEIDASWTSVSTSMIAGEHLYIQVSARTAGDTFSYELATADCTTCGADPGDDYLAAALGMPTCGTVLAAIDCAGDVDYSDFTGDYTFETTGSLDTEMKLYDANGDVINTDDDGGTGLNAKITHYLVAGVTYSVAVNEYGNDGTGRYDLVLSGCPEGCGSDPGNDYFADATPVASCTNVPADIDCLGDVDYYSFVPPNSGAFTFQTSGSLETEMKLYDANGGAQAYVVEVASASTRKFWIDVEDLYTGLQHRYENTSGGTSAFFPADRTTFQDSCNP